MRFDLVASPPDADGMSMLPDFDNTIDKDPLVAYFL